MILITGGAGYIGSHINKLLFKKERETVVFDNLSTGHRELAKWGHLEVGDLGKVTEIENVFKKYPIESVIHFAASKAVGESVENPEKYYYNNVVNTLNLLAVMKKQGVKKIVFSSSAATFGDPQYNPIDEKHPQNPINPYGYTKLVMEKMLEDYVKAYDFRYAALRYFNAAGADPDGEVGEWPGSGQNLIPLVLDAAIGVREEIKIFGTDYPTADGTCVRDYIHVSDLATAHVLALDYLDKESGCFNLGNGQGSSVKEVVAMAKRVTGVDFKVTESARRPGDPAILIADSSKAEKVLGWKPKYNELATIIKTAWDWRKKLA
ncbi:UDP-glucose 4-epimerase GalE [Patescibacteria group bacterium]|nr:UDP-glucose 4-epimerase GalE [Patescibacteria group bacterium]